MRWIGKKRPRPVKGPVTLRRVPAKTKGGVQETGSERILGHVCRGEAAVPPKSASVEVLTFSYWDSETHGTVSVFLG